jgi:hypothetical protein
VRIGDWIEEGSGDDGKVIGAPEDLLWLEKKTGEDVQERRVTDAGIGSFKLLMERIAECRA